MSAIKEQLLKDYENYMYEIGDQMAIIQQNMTKMSTMNTIQSGAAMAQMQAMPVKSKEPTSKQYIETIILGKMYEYNIPKDYFTDIKTKIYLEIMEESINSGRDNYGMSSVVFQKCEEHLPTYKFNSDIKELLDSK